MIILFLVGALGLGRLVVNALPLTWNRYEAWALAVLFGYFFGAWTLLIACSLAGFQIGGIVTVALLIAAWLLPTTRRPLAVTSFASARQAAVWLAATGTFSLVLGYLLYREMLDPGPGGAYSGAATITDLPLHLSIMTNVAYATRFTWRFSMMANTYLTYPFLVDFLSGMIVRWGASLRFGLLVVSIPLCLVLVQTLFFFGYRALKNARAAALLTFFFLLNGTSYGFIQLAIDFFHSRSHFLSLFRNSPNFYVYSVPNDFSNFIASLIPERTLQCGMSVFCAAMLLAFRVNRDMSVSQRRRVLLLTGALVGLLPLAHAHSFFMGFVSLVTLAVFGRRMADLRDWLFAIGVSLVLALPQLIFQVFSNKHSSFVRYQPGWLFYDQEFPHYSHSTALFLYILANFGILLVMAAISYRGLKGYSVIRGFTLLGTVIFIAAILYVFQPLDYDNIKFFFYVQLFLCLGIAQYLSLLSRAGRWQWVPLSLAIVATGTASVVWQLRQHYIIYSDKVLTEAQEYRRLLPRDALVLTSTYEYHPMWALAGQPVVEGFTDYLWTYGLPYKEFRQDVQSMYDGGDTAVQLLRKYQVQYVLISPYERKHLNLVNEPFFDHHFPLIYQHDGMCIYQIRRAS